MKTPLRENLEKNKIESCLKQELEAIEDGIKCNYSYEWLQNCVGYCEALCWVLGRELLRDLIIKKYKYYYHQN